MRNAQKVIDAYSKAHESIRSETKAYAELLDEVKTTAVKFFRNTKVPFESSYRWLEEVSYFEIEGIHYMDDNRVHVSCVSFSDFGPFSENSLSVEEIDNIVPFLEKELAAFVVKNAAKEEAEKQSSISRLEAQLERLRSE